MTVPPRAGAAGGGGGGGLLIIEAIEVDGERDLEVDGAGWAEQAGRGRASRQQIVDAAAAEDVRTARRRDL